MVKELKDPRHKRRQKTVQSLFAWGFNQTSQLTPTGKKVVEKLTKIDKMINDCAPKWPLEKINRIDLAILRLATYELIFDKKIPDKVSINEAVELAKEFGSENSASFVNGALGAVFNVIKRKDKTNGSEKKPGKTTKKN